MSAFFISEKTTCWCCCCCITVSESLLPHGLQHIRLLSFPPSSRSLLKFMSIESVMLSNHCIFCSPVLLPPIFPSIGFFSNELALCIRWPKYWNFSISSVNFSSAAQSCPTLCDPMDCSMPGLPAHQQLVELMQIHIH